MLAELKTGLQHVLMCVHAVAAAWARRLAHLLSSGGHALPRRRPAPPIYDLAM